jgi:hypothetical protein
MMARSTNTIGASTSTPNARSRAAKNRWKNKGQSSGNRASQRQQVQGGTIQQLQPGCTYGYGSHTIMTLPNGTVQFA